MAQHIYTGSGAPSTTPAHLGSHYIDTTNHINYIAAGTTSPSDWVSSDATVALASHVAASDPHTQYLKESDNLLVNPNIVRVKKTNAGAGEFTSIASAAESITTASSTNPFVIKVGAGEFTEPVINLPAYVSVEGESIQSTIVKPATGAQHLFVLATACELSFMSMIGQLGSGYAAIVVQNAGNFTQTHKLSIYDFDIGILHEATSADSFFYCEYTDINGDYTNAVKAVSSGGFSNRTQLENFYTYESANASSESIYGTGTNLEIQLYATKMFCNSTQKGIVISNGAKLRLNSGSIHGAERAIEVLNVGSACEIEIMSMTLVGNTYDYYLSHPGTIGAVSGTTDVTKNVVATGANVFGLAFDPTNGGVIMNGPLYYSAGEYNDLADVSQLITQEPAMGVIYGGDLSISSGLVLSIAAGYGHAGVGALPNEVLNKREWAAQTITLPASSHVYIYMNSSGAFVSNASFPNTEENMLLGRVVTDATNIIYIEKTPLCSHHFGNKVSRLLREAIGSVFVSGCLTTEIGTRNLVVTAGEYYFAENEFLPAGGSPITFDAYYRSSTPGVYTRVTGQTTVSNSQYDDGSGTLASIPANKHVKHLLLVVGGPSEKYLLIYGTAYYNSLAEAQAAPLPTTPSFVADSFARVASIIVEGGASAIQDIIDERPRVGFASSSSVGGLTSHSALTDLSADDHTQYLLVSGSRAMSGNLDMGANSISNVNLVGGVDVSAHASRHLPNGADPLSTGAPSSIGTANSTGTANAFARQDHVHDHGSQTDANHHAVATSVANGFMSSADKVKLDSVSSTELSYLSGVTSAIQTQINSKQATGNYITALTGDVTASGPGSVAATLANSGVTAGSYVNSSITVDAKGRITAASNGAGGVIKGVTTVTQSTTSTTHADITELVTPSLLVGWYEFYITGRYQAAATTTGIGFRVVQGTSVIGTINAEWNISQAGNGTFQDYQYKQLDQAVNTTSTSATTANTDTFFSGGGMFEVTTAGTVKVQFRSEVNGSSVSIRPNSVLRLISL